ncbi:bifunctional RNase H/acid phosphatase [Mumia sp. zg.B53]|uniref:bifunctional RNase H/acid phosphatase n=1 Tax=Mumia sp. zg.B53 TaxID=2855449 RepID=UPI001C6F4C7B|nr:bifunctional RNase H/acid phosphatase [Mumia sp. zg.B53]MBW9215915.1 bifunctional RNase H/acid phosphatase [Mumia sp. zg.B53]
MTAPRRVVIEADGGSRGNPGPAAYGAVLRDADTGAVIAQRAETIGIATNNVAEYSGLIAGLELLAEHAPEAEVEVRMDSKLVIEQMAGRWRVKHPDMKPLALRAQQLAPFGVEWTWVPRERNKAADAILNDALDEAAGKPKRRRAADPAPQAPGTTATAAPAGSRNPMVGWRDPLADPPTTLTLVRHGATDSTLAKVFSGSDGADPGLNDVGRAQVHRAAAYVSRADAEAVDVVVSSPLRRCRETAEVLANDLGVEVVVEPGLVEASFGAWDGLTFAQVQERDPEALDAWLASTAVAPPGGESYDDVFARVQRLQRRLVASYGGKHVVLVSHVTPIKMFVRLALDAPMPVIHRLELQPASVSTVRVWPDGISTLRAYDVVPV